jgi:hypothetical protein
MRTMALCFLVACARSQSSAALASASASVVAVAAAPLAPTKLEFGETDFRGDFNGAKVVATLRAKDGVVSGSCFYDAIGTDIQLSGTVKDDRTLVVSEMNGDAAVSTITVTRASDGALSGTWRRRRSPAQPCSRRSCTSRTVRWS